MLLPLIVAIIYGETEAGFAFLKSILTALPIGMLILFFVKSKSSVLKIRDGYIIAALCWFIASAYGAFPYLFSNAVPTYFDAYFESVSGLTTTGATIIADFSIMPKSIQFWRSFSHWLGAMEF
jgi:trk system potassium uptake protein TrkH